MNNSGTKTVPYDTPWFVINGLFKILFTLRGAFCHNYAKLLPLTLTLPRKHKFFSFLTTFC